MRVSSAIFFAAAAVYSQAAFADVVVTRTLPGGNNVFVKCIGACDPSYINARINQLRIAPGTQNSSMRLVITDTTNVGSMSMGGQSNAVVGVALGQSNSIDKVAVNGSNNLVRIVEQGRNNSASAVSVGARNSASIAIAGSDNRVTSRQVGSDMTTAIATTGSGTTVIAEQTVARNTASALAAPAARPGTANNARGTHAGRPFGGFGRRWR